MNSIGDFCLKGLNLIMNNSVLLQHFLFFIVSYLLIRRAVEKNKHETQYLSAYK